MPVFVLLGGVETIVYDAAPTAAVHDKSMYVVYVGVAATKLVGGAGRVRSDVDVAEPPSPLELTDTIVKV